MRLKMPSLLRLKLSVLGFIVSLVAWVVYAISPLAHEFDIHLAAWLLPVEARVLDERILILDVPGEAVEAFRGNLGAALSEIGAQRADLPLQVALDVAFLRPGTAQVEAGIDRLRLFGRQVLAACPRAEGFDPYTTCVLPAPTRALYERFDALGHTYFLAHVSAPYFKPCPPVPSLIQLLAAQIAKVKADCGDYQYVHMGLPLERVGSPQLISFDAACPTRFRQYAADCLAVRPAFFGKTVLVGRVALDRSPFAERSGTELIGWALNDQLSGAQYPSLLSDVGVLLAMLLFTVVLAKALFWLLLRNLRRLRDKPWAIALIAGLFGVLILLALIAVLNLAGRYYTMVTLPLLQLLIVLGFASLYQRRQRLLEIRRQGGRSQYVQYDVFISYRSNYRDQVRQDLLQHLHALRRADGARLNVFFDNRKLHSGEFEPQLAASIRESRVFVAFLTPNYFDPANPWCSREMQAAREAGCQLLLVMAEGYNPQSPPDAFAWLRTLHHFNVQDADFADKFVREVRRLEAAYEGAGGRQADGELPRLPDASS